MKEICVVHLVRAQNGIEPFSLFLDSYLQNQGEIEHDLLIVFKGFETQGVKDEYLNLLSPIQHLVFEVPDDIGFDIDVYFAVAKQYADTYRYFCFLNSFSIIQDREWLIKLYKNISSPQVGLVGASASWQSHRVSRLLVVDLANMAIQHYRLYKEKVFWKRSILGLAAAYQLAQLLWDVKPFPNFHLRTNAFMISSEIMMKVVVFDFVSKFDAYRFESGKNGLTQQIVKMGKDVLVVGRDGIGYKEKQWDLSNTFWQSEQQNLLVADNQTRAYQNAEPDRRMHLSKLAWGDQAVQVANK